MGEWLQGRAESSILGGKALPNNPNYIRWLIHLLLAIFLANAANKFFVGDLAYELQHGFYARIFSFAGDAPDQYRILPLLPLKWLQGRLSFNYSVLLYNIFFSLLVFESFWQILGKVATLKKYVVNIVFALLYIYCQYTGWRPDTMGLLAVASGLVLLADRVEASGLRSILLLIMVAALTFCRAEIALIFALWLAIYQVKSWPLRIILVLLPLAGQVLLQWVIFPDAIYYSKKVMLWDNLSLYYVIRHPATYLWLASLIAFRHPVWKFIKHSYAQAPYLWFLFIGYFLLILLVGRVNEYRLYLPFVPLFLLHARKLKSLANEKETLGIV